MKKYITLLLAFSLLTACSYKEDAVFEKESNQRVDASLETFKKVVEENEGYWVLHYYPGVSRSFAGFPEAPRGIGGYNFVVKIKDGTITASSEVSNSNAEVQSLYTYSLSEGPMLTLDTYSSIMHHFHFVSTTFTSARGGDVEFFYLNNDNGVVTLKGRTSGNLMTLTKLEGDREAFLNKIRENAQTLKGNGLNPIAVNGTEVQLTFFPSYRQIVFSYGEQTVQRAFIVTQRGIKLYEPVVINGVTFDEFYINDDKTALTTPDGAISTSFAPSPIVLPDVATGQYKEAPFARRIGTRTPWVSAGVIRTAFTTARTGVQTGRWNEETIAGRYTYTLHNVMEVYKRPANDGGLSDVFTLYAYRVRDTNGALIRNPNVYEVSIVYEVELVGVPGQPDQVQIYLKDPNIELNSWQFFPELLLIHQTFADNGPYQIIDSPRGGNYYRFLSVKDNEVYFEMQK